GPSRIRLDTPVLQGQGEAGEYLRGHRAQAKVHLVSHTHSHLRTLWTCQSAYRACLWTGGGNQSTWRKTPHSTGRTQGVAVAGIKPATPKGRRGTWSLSHGASGTRQGTPCTRFQCVCGHNHIHPFIHYGQFSMSGGGNLSTRRKPPQHGGEHANSTHTWPSGNGTLEV
ncbi:hypothetical protein AMELA_G00225810, partial [Ameiurus melas]